MENKCRRLIDPTEFQQKVLDYIGSDELNKMIDSTVFKSNSECKNAIVHGMVIASMLTCRCESIYVKEETKSMYENLVFTKPYFLNKEKVIDEFSLKHVFTNDRASIYENDDVRFCFDKKVIRVLLYDNSNKELKKRIQDYFYEKRWKQ